MDPSHSACTRQIRFSSPPPRLDLCAPPPFAGAKIDEDANPFSPPKKPIPPPGKGRYPASVSCYPGKPDSGAAGATCKANKGCQALEGNCCPNDGGDMLACCG